MKRLLLILLCVPLIGLGQSFDFNDIKKINSEKKFKVFALENLYSTIQTDDNGWEIKYLYKFETDGSGNYKDGPQSFIQWYKKLNLFTLHFYLEYEDVNKTFEAVINQIKSECEFYDIFQDESARHQGIFIGKEQYVCYSCSNSKYKGKIGFAIREYEGTRSGIIQTFDF
jgi:hypothetical protein